MKVMTLELVHVRKIVIWDAAQSLVSPLPFAAGCDAQSSSYSNYFFQIMANIM